MPDYDLDQKAGPNTDGRNLRAQRTAQQIASAYLELLEEGDLRPAVRDVAERAGVSERAVFRHFQDIESLFHAVAKIQIATLLADAPDLVSPDASLTKRIDSFLARWCWVFEAVTPVRRAANINEPFSPEIQRRRAWGRQLRMQDFETLFERELSKMTAEDRSDALDAASAGLRWATWEHLRTVRKRSAKRATAHMARMLRALVSGKF